MAEETLNDNYKINKYKIVFSDNSNENITIDSLVQEPVDLNKNLELQVSLVETLDKYDDMQLKISSNSYRKVGEYGIEYDENIHGGEAENPEGNVILNAQRKAAKYFLGTLRGFGILADTVGSGKTYEAGVILSELALTGKITNLLIVVPNRELLVKWKRTIEYEFGMGKDTIYEVEDISKFSIKDENGKRISAFTTEKFNKKGETITLSKPNVAMIVTKDNFVKWNKCYSAVENLLFECIVVDEAHFLNDEEGDGAIALRLLSRLMQNKKIANKDNCLLITATPHSGNLEKMFNLWYFKIADGVYPNDFYSPSGKPKSEKYNQYKKLFDSNCRYAKTVSEFIEAAKDEFITIASDEGRAFAEYLGREGITLDQYRELTELGRRNIRDKFLDAKENSAIKESVLKKVSNLYHRKVIGMIMRRETQTHSNGIQKDVTNIFICPVNEKTLKMREEDLQERWKAGDGICENLDRMYEPDAIKIKRGNKTISISLEEYLKERSNKKKVDIIIDDVLSNSLFKADSNTPFIQAGSAGCYKQLLSENKKDIENGLLDNQFRIMYDYDSEKPENVFNFKLKELERILENNPDDKIIVFFDYQRKCNIDSEPEWNKIYDAFSSDPRFKDRLILATTGKEVVSEYNARSNAIFLAGSEKYTEGIDMQSGHIVVNFSVTHDPVAMSQRVGRVFRLGQDRNVQIISLAMMNELEGYALAYQTCIGLLSTNEGDATIIAGCNSENMKAFTCKSCEDMKLMTIKEYDEEKDEEGYIYCKNPLCKIQSGGDKNKGMPYTEITATEYKCTSCGEKLSKRFSEDNGYYCLSRSDSASGKMYSIADPQNKIVIGCSKLCVIKHCAKIASFGKDGVTVPCAILKTGADDINDARALCMRCENLRKGFCDKRCSMLSALDFSDCGKCSDANCHPKPHKIQFENDMAECPACKKGTLKPSGTKTFASYLYQSFEYGRKKIGSDSFCKRLLGDKNSVTDIRMVLDKHQD